MATNENQTVSQFAQDAPEPTELERIQKRIAEFKIGFTINSAGVVNALVQSHLKSGNVTQGELIPLDAVTREYAAGQEEYNTMVQNAQRRAEELIAADNLAKQELFAQRQREQDDRLSSERVKRKEADLKIAQLEAVLASHGINMDLNNDGVIGVKQGELNSEGFVQLSAEEIGVLAKQHGYELPTPPPQTPLAPKKSATGAFGLARAMNPAPDGVEEEPYIPLDTPQSHTKVDLANPAPTHPADGGWDTPTEETQETIQPAEEVFDSPAVETPIFQPSGTTTESFLDEVERVDEVAQADEIIEDKPLSTDEAFNDKIEETKQSFQEWVDANDNVTEDTVEEDTGFELSDEVQPLGSEFQVQEEDVRTESEFAKPVITGGNFKPRAETLQDGDEVSAPVTEKTIPSYDTEEELLAAAQAKIDAQTDVEEEESYDEITIPSSAELDAMTKTGIKKAAEGLDFTVNTSDTKAQMIESFQDQTDEFIQSLQDDGSFVSAVDSDGDKDNDDDTVRDGGYF